MLARKRCATSRPGEPFGPPIWVLPRPSIVTAEPYRPDAAGGIGPGLGVGLGLGLGLGLGVGLVPRVVKV